MPFCPREQTGSGSVPWASEAVPGTRSRTAPPERCPTLTNAPSAAGLKARAANGEKKRHREERSKGQLLLQGRRRTQPRAGDCERSAGQQEQTGNEKKHQAGLIHGETTRNSHRALAEPQPAAQNRLIWIPDKRGEMKGQVGTPGAAPAGTQHARAPGPKAHGPPAARLVPCSHLP